MISLTVVSLKSRMFVIMSRSVSSITPFSSPSPTMWRISSSVTVSSSALGSLPNRRMTPSEIRSHSRMSGRIEALSVRIRPMSL